MHARGWMMAGGLAAILAVGAVGAVAAPPAPPAPPATRPAAPPTSRPDDATTRPDAPATPAEVVRHPAAVAVAERTLEAMGGRDAWRETRCLTWTFFGRRRHVWDTHTGDVRIEYEGENAAKIVVLMNLGTRRGQVWRDGAPVEDETVLTEMLEAARGMWVNDGYWLVMPYKLLDPGVSLRHLGERRTADGAAADVLELTFADGIGVTPQNKYHVYVGRDSGLVEQWDFFAKASDAEPRFQLPWREWKRHGEIMLSGDRGRVAFSSSDVPGAPTFGLTEIDVFDVDDRRFARLSSLSMVADTSNRGEESHDGR